MSILIQSENVQNINQNPKQSSDLQSHNEENTETLREKMQQLQLEIESLQKLKEQRNLSEKKSENSKMHKSINNENLQSQKQVEYGSSSVISQSAKNTKINDLVSQLSHKEFFPTKRKRSWSKTIAPHSQRKSLRNLQETLQKIDISEQRNNRKISAKIFHKKQQSNNVQSNIFNVTIAEIMAGQYTKKEEDKIKMLEEINDLKSKILELTSEKQMKKQVIQQKLQAPKVSPQKYSFVNQIDLKIQQTPTIHKNLLVKQEQKKATKDITQKALKIAPSPKGRQSKYKSQEQIKPQEEQQKFTFDPTITARFPIKTRQFSPYLEQQKTQRGAIKINQLTLNEQEPKRFNYGFLSTPERTQTNRLNQNPFIKQVTGTGKIYSRSRLSRPKNHENQDFGTITTFNFQIQHPQHSIQLRRNMNPLTWNPQITLTLLQSSEDDQPNQTKSGRIYNSLERRKNVQQSEQKMSQSKKPLFNINKKKRVISQSKKEDSVPKIVQKAEQVQIEIKEQQKIKQNSEQQSQEKINEQMVQTKKQFKKPEERLNQMKINLVKSDSFPPKDLLPNFKQYIDSKLISIALPPTPSSQFGQSQLEQLGKTIFELFDVFVEQMIQKKGVEYKVTKYKNCVLFRLNEEINIVWYFDGRFYFGGWEISLIGEAKKEGFGFQINPNKYIYQGFFKSSKREGYGIMCQFLQGNSKTTSIYDGFWKQGMKNGKGYQAQAQLQYYGDFQMGLQTGRCKIKTLYTLYRGQIRDSVKVGKGHQILKNGDEYFGDFQGNLFQGTGEYRWKSGAYFYGSFMNGTRKGTGIWLSNLFSEKFDIYKGSYEDNKKNGYGVYQWANETIYDGSFKNDLRHDEGIMVFPNGKVAKFIWKEGEKVTKLYCEQEQTYRRTRNSSIKANQEKIDQSNQTNPSSSKHSSFVFQVLNQLQKASLVLFSSPKSIQ